MILNLSASAMYLELSRAFINLETEITKSKTLNSIDDIPRIVQINLKFIQFAGAVIFSISYLEAYVNQFLNEFLHDRFDLSYIKDAGAKAKVASGIADLKTKFSNAADAEELFKREKLSKKLNLVYTALGLQRLSESPNADDQFLWTELLLLQDIRNELIHVKADFIESPDFIKFFNLDEAAFKKRLNVPSIIVAKLISGLPLIQPNLADNVILKRLVFCYKDDAIAEHLMLTGTEYNKGNVQAHGTRWIF